eukprot:scaffold124529_cov38-Prasinocladus_malaysianus.AAC.1
MQRGSPRKYATTSPDWGTGSRRPSPLNVTGQNSSEHEEADDHEHHAAVVDNSATWSTSSSTVTTVDADDTPANSEASSTTPALTGNTRLTTEAEDALRTTVAVADCEV